MQLTFSTLARVAGRVGVFAGVTLLAGSSGCFHVSQRAWDNGRAMRSSLQYGDILAGRRDPAALRALYYSSTSLPSAQRNVRYPAFGHW